MKTTTITVAIPAYNEETNIASVITSVLGQEQLHYKMERILILLDGCTDRTEEIVREMAKKYPTLSLSSHPQREGKVKRLNEIFKKNISDILVIFDADIKLGSDTTIDQMVIAHAKNQGLDIVVAHQIPLKAKTYIGKVIYAGYQMWDNTRLSIPNADYIQNLYGAATAYKKSFTQTTQIPSNITDETGYLYLLAKQHGGFAYIYTAWIYYWPVTTAHDFFKLGDRSFTKNQDILAKIFGRNVYDLYAIPLKYKLKGILITLMQNPIYAILSVCLNMLSRFFPQHDKLYEKGMWEMSTSTKVSFSEEGII